MNEDTYKNEKGRYEEQLKNEPIDDRWSELWHLKTLRGVLVRYTSRRQKSVAQCVQSE